MLLSILWKFVKIYPTPGHQFHVESKRILPRGIEAPSRARKKLCVFSITKRLSQQLEALFPDFEIQKERESRQAQNVLRQHNAFAIGYELRVSRPAFPPAQPGPTFQTPCHQLRVALIFCGRCFQFRYEISLSTRSRTKSFIEFIDSST